ncbi:response regulator transcription factor [Vagococcus elongatus]|nr:response regulator transcription factor [Vagococcus elongatus]
MEKILIVEDNLEVSEMLEKILQESYQVVLLISSNQPIDLSLPDG